MATQDKSNLRKIEKELGILANKTRLEILSLLAGRDKKVNFNEIADKIDIKRNSLAYHIALLKNNGFISNELRKNKNEGSFSYYDITEKGRKLFSLVEQMDKNFEKEEKELEKILS